MDKFESFSEKVSRKSASRLTEYLLKLGSWKRDFGEVIVRTLVLKGYNCIFELKIDGSNGDMKKRIECRQFAEILRNGDADRHLRVSGWRKEIMGFSDRTYE
jgi:hypothetical protein